MSNKSGIALFSFLAGALFGAIIALLYAPLAGEEMRGQIRQQAAETSHQLQTQVDKAVKSMQKSLSETQKQIQVLLKQTEAEAAKTQEEA